jgi:hypothetical protein
VSDALPLRLIAAALTSIKNKLSKPLATRLSLPAVDSINVMESEVLLRKDATFTALSLSVRESDALDA